MKQCLPVSSSCFFRVSCYSRLVAWGGLTRASWLCSLLHGKGGDAHFLRRNLVLLSPEKSSKARFQAAWTDRAAVLFFTAVFMFIKCYIFTWRL